MSNLEELPNPPASTAKVGYVFRWTTDKISCCTLAENKSLKSATFSTKSLNDTEWYMEMYPMGYQDKNAMMCFLHRTDKGPEEVSIEYSITLGGSYFLYSHTLKKNSKVASGVINRDQFMQRIAENLSNDELVVECIIWQSTFLLTSNTTKYPKMCSAFTRIPVEKWDFECTLEDFSTTSLNVNFPVAPLHNLAPELIISFSKARSPGSSNMLEVQRKTWLEESEAIRNPFYLKCKLQIKDVQNRYYNLGETSHVFSPAQPLMFLTFNVNDIIRNENKNQFLPMDNLTLKCEFSVSYEDAISGIEFISFDCPEYLDKQSGRVSMDFKESFEYKYNENIYLFRFIVVLVIFLALAPHFLFN